MTDEDKALVKYRMERAFETLQEAGVLFDAGHINTYVNRLYYACFYAVSALLISRGQSTSKHGYLRSLFHKEFDRVRQTVRPSVSKPPKRGLLRLRQV